MRLHLGSDQSEYHKMTSMLYVMFRTVQCTLFSAHLRKCRYVGEGYVDCNEAEKIGEDEKRICADPVMCCQIFSEDQSEQFSPNTRRGDIVIGS